MGTKKSGPRPMSATAAALPVEEPSDLPEDSAPPAPDLGAEWAGAGEPALPGMDPAPAVAPEVTPTPSRRVRDRAPHSLALAEHKVTSTRPPTKYTVLLDAITDDEFERLAQHAASTLGRIRTEGTRRGRYPSRSDVVRALVHLASTNHELRDRMLDQIEKDVSS